MTGPLYIFHHLRKTGGTTLNNHLYGHLEMDEEVVHFGFAGDNWRKNRGKPAWQDRSQEDRQRAQVLVGHGVYWGIHELLPQREARYFTIIREPISQLVSMYNYSLSKGRVSEPFEDWVRRASLMTKELKKQLRGAMSIEEFLGRCWYVGTTATLDADISLISENLGIPTSGWRNVRVAGSSEEWVLDGHVEPVIEKKLEVTDVDGSLIKQLYPEEFLIWSKAQELREKLYGELKSQGD